MESEAGTPAGRRDPAFALSDRSSIRALVTVTRGQELLDLFAAAHGLRTATRESGLTKSEVARRAGVSRSRLDAYLRAESQPSRS